MPDTIIAALLRSKTPEEFVQKALIPSLIEREVKILDNLGRKPDKFASRNGKVYRIDFEGPENGPTIPFYFEKLMTPNSRLPPTQRPEKGYRSKFRARVGNKSFFSLEPVRFQMAAKKSDFIKYVHFGENPSVSHFLYFDHQLLLKKEGWKDKIRTDPKNPKIIGVKLDKNEYDLLNGLDRKTTFLERYMNSLSHLTNKPERIYRSHQNYFGYEVPKGQKYNAYQLFHLLYAAEHAPFFEKIANAQLEELKQIIQSHLNLPPKISEYYAKGLGRMLWGRSTASVRDAARKIAADSRKKIEEIESPVHVPGKRN